MSALTYLSPAHYRAEYEPVAPADSIERAARMLVAAERPLLHPGGGVLRSGAWDEVCALAEYLSATVTTSQGACGVLPEDHPLCLIPGGYGALGAQAAADVVVLIGDARTTLRALLEAVKRLTPPVPVRPDTAEYRATQEGWLAQFEEEAPTEVEAAHAGDAPGGE